MWADWEFYTTKYLLGDKPDIPEPQFPRREREARDLINDKNLLKVEIEDPPDYLKMLVCEIAELIHEGKQAPKPGEAKSESNAGYSYTIQGKTMTEKEFRRYARSLIADRLFGTPLQNVLVFGGVS